jgi:hypothetical protein
LSLLVKQVQFWKVPVQFAADQVGVGGRRQRGVDVDLALLGVADQQGVAGGGHAGLQGGGVVDAQGHRADRVEVLLGVLGDQAEGDVVADLGQKLGAHALALAGVGGRTTGAVGIVAVLVGVEGRNAGGQLAVQQRARDGGLDLAQVVFAEGHLGRALGREGRELGVDDHRARRGVLAEQRALRPAQ